MELVHVSEHDVGIMKVFGAGVARPDGYATVAPPAGVPGYLSNYTTTMMRLKLFSLIVTT